MSIQSLTHRHASRWHMRALLALAAALTVGQAHAGVTLYEHDGFRGRAVTINSRIPNLKANGFNDLASSAYVDNGTWLVCEDDNFRGRCVVLQPGSYGSLESLGMQDNITSVRPYRRGEGNWDSAPPQGAPNYGYYRRPNEQVFEAPVTSVRAVSGAGEQRCWSLTLLSYSFNETPRVTLKGVNEWNNNAWGVRGMLYKDGTSGVGMNLGLNGGVTADWVAKRFGNFDYWLSAFGDFVAGTTPTPAPSPTPTP